MCVLLPSPLPPAELTRNRRSLNAGPMPITKSTTSSRSSPPSVLSSFPFVLFLPFCCSLEVYEALQPPQMNLVTGLWGMNVKVPGQSDGPGNDNLHWFVGVSCPFSFTRPALTNVLTSSYPQIVGCLCALALGGAFLTYKVRFFLLQVPPPTPADPPLCRSSSATPRAFASPLPRRIRLRLLPFFSLACTFGFLLFPLSRSPAFLSPPCSPLVASRPCSNRANASLAPDHFHSARRVSLSSCLHSIARPCSPTSISH